MLPPNFLLDRWIEGWLQEDIGRGDWASQAVFESESWLSQEHPTKHFTVHKAQWVAKQSGAVAGLPIAARVFARLDRRIQFTPWVPEGGLCAVGQPLAEMQGSGLALLMGERVALNVVMHLSGIATLTRRYCRAIAGTGVRLADTRKTTPGLRILEKYATRLGGAVNHRLGLDDAVMLKDNHIAAAGSLTAAVQQARTHMPFPLSLEVETDSLALVREVAPLQVEIVMLDNMGIAEMAEAIAHLRAVCPRTKIEVSGNVTLERLPEIAALRPDYISTSALVTRAPWLDISMRFQGEAS
ncbi:MAG: carboxylating nicotinate-nucleotide diphosphorylase [Pseudanabaenaceae cyanobacterium]